MSEMQGSAGERITDTMDNGKKVDVLLTMLQQLRADYSYRRNMEWVMAAALGFAYLVAAGRFCETPLHGCKKVWAICLVWITFVVTSWFLWKLHILAMETARVVVGVERILGLFEQKVYASDMSVLPPAWQRHGECYSICGKVHIIGKGSCWGVISRWLLLLCTVLAAFAALVF